MFRAWSSTLFVLCGLAGCRSAAVQEEKHALQAASAALAPVSSSVPALRPYPRATWRLASPAQLSASVLWVSHILIRQVEARPEVSFNLAYWFSAPTVTRSREEALRLATVLSERAEREPAGFGELARQYSEDLPSRDEGGALGALSAGELESWPQVLDALATLRPGKTSRVVETRYGFHIFYRSEPPPEQTRSGSHIVIGHDRAQWLAGFARAPVPARSREQALELATEVYRRARAEPAIFGELVQRHSEHRDALDGGDFGAWSTREPSAFPLRQKRLGELEVGEVGRPIETHLGFEIVLRTPERPRGRFRARVLPLPVGELTDAPGAATTNAREATLARARQLLARVAREPAHWAQQETRVFDWQEGRGAAGLSSQLASVGMEQFLPVPIQSEHGVLIVQRLAPLEAMPPTFRTELPAPEQPNVVQFISAQSPAVQAHFLGAPARRAGEQLALPDGVAGRLRELHDASQSWDANAPPETRLGLLRELLADTRQLLGDATYDRYLGALQREIRTAVLRPADNAAPELGL